MSLIYSNVYNWLKVKGDEFLQRKIYVRMGVFLVCVSIVLTINSEAVLFFFNENM